jgi:hypothetical protein
MPKAAKKIPQETPANCPVVELAQKLLSGTPTMDLKLSTRRRRWPTASRATPSPSLRNGAKPLRP